jgi:hypothetical protein
MAKPLFRLGRFFKNLSSLVKLNYPDFNLYRELELPIQALRYCVWYWLTAETVPAA